MAKQTRTRMKISDDEPRWNPEKEECQLAQMLNWYNYNKSADDAKKYFIEFLKQSGEAPYRLTQIQECSSISISNTIGWLCRIKLINGNVTPTKYDNKIQEERAKVLQVVDAKEESSKQPELSEKRSGIQDHLENQLRNLLGELAAREDEFLLSGLKTSFDVYEWLKTNAVKHQHAKNIAEYYESVVLSELQEADAGECEQLKEAYSHLKKPQMKKYIAFVESIVSESRRWCDVAKQISLNNRAPRVKKPKSALKQTAKLKYQKESEGLKSIPPTQIVGATQLWVYNTKYRTLGVYVCNNSHGFSVKGCTILNYDASESLCKKLRKPEEILPKVLEAGKVALRKILPTIRSKEKKLTGRINGDTILLKVV
jgi:hypothetical protein